MELTYESYLKVEELLSLQVPLSDGPEHDETLFIVIHQVYELWFKEVLHELDHIRGRLDQDDVEAAFHTLKRILTILKTMVGQVDVIETMTPLEFLSFRDRLQTASGFQSCQFREVEFALGKKDPAVMERFPEGRPARARLERRLREPSLWRAFLGFLHRQGHVMPAGTLEAEPERPTAESEAVQAVILDVYRGHPALGRLCELLVDLDEGLQEWRYRHVKMVERTIGTKTGTGGSAGVAYLRSTLFAPVFPDLWAIRGDL